MKNNKLKSLLNQRKYRYGTLATLMILGVILLVVLINVTAGAVEDRFGLAIDASVLKASELDDQTLQVLEDLDQDVYVYTVYQNATSDEMRIQLEEMLRSYGAFSDRFHWDNIDPVTNPLWISKLTDGEAVDEGTLIVTNADESRVKVLDVSDYYYNYNFEFTGGTYTIFSAESQLSSALLYVTSDHTNNVYFLQGHLEIDPEKYFVNFISLLENSNYHVDTIDLSDADAVLEKGDVLIVVDPSVDLTDEEYRVMQDWLNDGGRLMMCMYYECDINSLPNFVKLMDYYQLGFDEGYIQESQNSTNNWLMSVQYLKPTLNAEHEITAGMTPYQFMPYARPVKEVAMTESGTVYTSLMTTSASAKTVLSDGSATTGTRTVAMAMQQVEDNPEDETRIVLVGSSPILADAYSTSYLNLDFANSAVRWLVNDDTETVDIMADLVDTDSLVISSGTDFWTLTALVVVILPLIAAVAGVVVWVRRRRL